MDGGSPRADGLSRVNDTLRAEMVVLDGSPLEIGDVVAVARHGQPVSVADLARQRMAPARALVERIDAADDVCYGVTTGFGALADHAISRPDRAALQRAVVRSHAAGMGPPLPAEVVRGMLLLRARTLCAGWSGVRPSLVEAMVALLGSGLVPWVPEHGSLGASGDLAPLAHVAACLLGEGFVLDAGGGPAPAAAALQAHGLSPVELGVKEGLALINGTDAMAATLALCVHDVAALLAAADCACAMSVEALLGTARVFDPDVVALRPSTGQRDSAANLRALLRDSPMVA
jgi:histidine ammonia-lyase